MDFFDFPPSLLREQSVCWELIGDTVAGGRTGTDAAPLARTDGGGLWKCTLEKVSLRTAQQVKLWRASERLADGGATPILVTACEARYAPWPTVNGAILRGYGLIPHSDGTTMSDGSGYYQPAIVAWLALGASLRATTIELKMMQAADLTGGEAFSILHRSAGWCRYEICGVASARGWQGDAHNVVTIRPPLREDVDGTEAIDFDRVRCLMRLATPDAMRLVLEQRKYGSPNVSFIETFDVTA